MLRIDRAVLDKAVLAFMECAMTAKDTSGLRVVFPVDLRQAEASVLAALSAVAPNGGPVVASDVYFMQGIGDKLIQFPLRPETA